MPRKSTRNAQGGGTIRQRPDGRWEARYTVGRDPGIGKQIQRSVYGSTQKEVRQKLAQITAIDKGTYQTPNKITVSAWMVEWLNTFCAGKVKLLTFQSYQSIIKNHITPAIGSQELQVVKGLHIQRMYNTMTRAGLSGKTVKNVSAVLHKAFSVALKQGIIAVNPCDAAELPKAERKEIRPLTDSEIPRFLTAIDDSPMRNAFALCLFAGLREGECLGLSWKQVDFERGRITVSQQLQREKVKGGRYYIAPSTKSGKPRTVMPAASAFQALRKQKAKQAEQRLKAGPLWANPWGLIFTDDDGGPMLQQTAEKEFSSIRAAAGLEGFRFHDLRHPNVKPKTQILFASWAYI